MKMHPKPMIRHSTHVQDIAGMEIYLRAAVDPKQAKVQIVFTHAPKVTQSLILDPEESRKLERDLHVANAGISGTATQPDDTAMLEWMQFHGARVAWGNDDEYCRVRWDNRDGSFQTRELFSNWREAIRAAMRGEVVGL